MAATNSEQSPAKAQSLQRKHSSPSFVPFALFAAILPFGSDDAPQGTSCRAEYRLTVCAFSPYLAASPRKRF
jgi:hypothetical protein